MTRIAVNVELKGFEALKQRDLNDAIRDALSNMGVRWKRRYLPLHFTKAGARKYNYKPRQGELNPLRRGTYTNRKLRLFSHTLPNVYTGELRRLSLQGQTKTTAKSTASRAHVRVHLPRKANFRLHELSIVSPDEQAELEKFLVEDLERQFTKRGQSGTVKVSLVP
ncbi:MAG: hypothetical protein DWQ31_16600 [Planctomycetota bacterium]|nr:MAG: hypothetical protein DWQ31_16600 [Planctomycetota bacterium]